jgi:hypothetical protein
VSSPLSCYCIKKCIQQNISHYVAYLVNNFSDIWLTGKKWRQFSDLPDHNKQNCEGEIKMMVREKSTISPLGIIISPIIILISTVLDIESTSLLHWCNMSIVYDLYINPFWKTLMDLLGTHTSMYFLCILIRKLTHISGVRWG